MDQPPPITGARWNVGPGPVRSADRHRDRQGDGDSCDLSCTGRLRSAQLRPLSGVGVACAGALWNVPQLISHLQLFQLCFFILYYSHDLQQNTCRTDSILQCKWSCSYGSESHLLKIHVFHRQTVNWQTCCWKFKKKKKTSPGWKR